MVHCKRFLLQIKPVDNNILKNLNDLLLANRLFDKKNDFPEFGGCNNIIILVYLLRLAHAATILSTNDYMALILS